MMVLKNLHNFSIVGIVGRSSLQVVLVGCIHSHVLKIYTSNYVNIRNVSFRRCYRPQLQPYMHFTSLYLSWCFSCVLESVTFTNFGIVGENLMGNSSLNRINITQTTGQFCQGITLAYWDDNQLLTDKSKYHLIMNKIHITEIGNGSKCLIINDKFSAGLSVYLIRQGDGTILLNNSLFKRIYTIQH